MFCCPSCFTDRFIEEAIRSLSDEQGTCSFCGSENVPLLMPSRLVVYFLPVIDLYELHEGSGAESLADLFQRDWRIFSSRSHSELFFSICTEKHVPAGDYLAKHTEDNSLISEWEQFSNELKHENRYFLRGADHKLLPFLLTFLITEYQPHTPVYRARVNSDEGVHYKRPDLLNPPPNLAKAGRANPVGISYLYTASTRDTAIVEVRPQRDDIVTVAQFTLEKTLSFIDLRDPYQTFTPFGHDDGDLETLLYRGLPLLQHLGRELSKPVHTRHSDLEYLPSQYLCELIKSRGYDGIIYESSFGKGDNYVTFSSNGMRFVYAEEYQIKNTSLEFERRK